MTYCLVITWKFHKLHIHAIGAIEADGEVCVLHVFFSISGAQRSAVATISHHFMENDFFNCISYFTLKHTHIFSPWVVESRGVLWHVLRFLLTTERWIMQAKSLHISPISWVLPKYKDHMKKRHCEHGNHRGTHNFSDTFVHETSESSEIVRYH